MKQIIDVAVGEDSTTGEGCVLLQITLAEDSADFRIKLPPKDATAIGKLLVGAGFKASLKKAKPQIVIPQ